PVGTRSVSPFELCATNSFAGWSDMMHNTKYYVGADYAFGHYKHGGVLENAKENYNSGTLNIGVRMDKVGLEAFNQMSGKRTKDMDAGRLKTRVNAYGLDMYAYQPLGCEGNNRSCKLLL
ncbi:MAG: hypothetical protein MJ210_03865, partial [Alphaproteobacteria bacterium]|nr:hypothetical protein [Alphaproteobacteria bacterium]